MMTTNMRALTMQLPIAVKIVNKINNNASK